MLSFLVRNVVLRFALQTPSSDSFLFTQAAGLGNFSLDLANATADEFYGELTSFRETTYPGMMLGQEPDGRTWKDYIGFVDGHLRYITCLLYTSPSPRDS